MPYVASEHYTPRANIYIKCDETNYTIIVMKLTIVSILLRIVFYYY